VTCRDLKLTRTMTRKTAIAISLVTTLLIGCAPASKTQPSNINLAGFPSAFKEGYGDGCQSVGQTNMHRDDKRFASDRQYASGWRDGFDTCSRRAKGQNN
jgi:hypothetical protein